MLHTIHICLCHGQALVSFYGGLHFGYGNTYVWVVHCDFIGNQDVFQTTDYTVLFSEFLAT